MTLDVNSALGQSDTAYSGFSDYFKQLNLYLLDTSGSVTPPDFAITVALLDYSELYRVALTMAGDSASYENGAALENIHHIVAVIREFGIRMKNKVSYYSDAASESDMESNFYNAFKIFWGSMLTGNFSQGETS